MTPTEVVQTLLDRFGRGDLSGVLELVADDAVFVEYENPVVPYAGRWMGKAGVERFFTALGTVRVTAFEPMAFLAAGDRVFVPLRWAGTVTATGKSFDSELMMDWTVRGGEVVRYRAYEDLSLVAAAFRGA